VPSAIIAGGSMPDADNRLLRVLDVIDYALAAAGAAVLIIAVVRWWHRGGRDPLRGSPIRANGLSFVHVYAVLLVYFLTAMIGAQLAVLATPPGIDDSLLKVWRSVLATNLTQILLAMACLVVGRIAFTSGWRSFGIGRRPWAGEIGWALGAWLVAFGVCGPVAMGTEYLIKRLRPGYEFSDHGVFQLLESPDAPPVMMIVAIVGAFLLAPVGEELFFRGILQTGFRKLIASRPGSLRHRWGGILITAGLFGVVHGSTPHHIPALILLAIILGFVYEKRGSLTTVILIHLLFNGKSLLWYQLQRMGG
jgi:membrane protease YdiL (CAAX protease family)